MINFKDIEIEGFASFLGVHKFKFGKRGLNIIKAPNGSGKTKLISSIYWAIYGQTLGDHAVAPWDTIWDEEYKGTMVTLRYEIDKVPHKIIRCLDYKGKVEGATGKSRLVYFVNGVLCDFKDKRDIQSTITKDLGFSIDLFKNSILFGQKLKRFVGETGTKKKEILEQAFEVDYLAKIRDSRAKGLKDMKAYLSELENTYRYKSELDEEYRESIAHEKHAESQFEESTREDITELTVKIQDLQKSIGEISTAFESDYKKEIWDLDELILRLKTGLVINPELELYKVQNDMRVTRENIAKVKSQLLAVPTVPLTHCPRCSEKLSPSGLIRENKMGAEGVKSLKDQITLWDGWVKNHQIAITKAEKSITTNKDINKLIDQYRAKIADLEVAHSNQVMARFEMEGWGKRIKDWENDIKKLQEKKFDVSRKQELYRKSAKLKLVMQRISNKITKAEENIELENWLINDPLSSSGMKTFIFDSFLQYVNKALKDYILALGFKVTLEVDMKSSNKDINTFIRRDKTIIPYADLSGGQQQLCDVAIAFALHEVITDNKNINLLILDEIFEGLDAKNIEVISKIIENKSKEKLVYLITHQDSFITINSNTINIGITNGHSSIN